MEKTKIILISFIITLIILIPLIIYTFQDYKQTKEINKQKNNYTKKIGIYYEISDNNTFYIQENNTFKKIEVKKNES